MSDVSAAPAGTTAGPAASRPGQVLLVASGAIFLAFLDITVVNVAFPELQQSFPGVSLATMTWVVTGYAVPFAALLAAAGRLADVLGRRRLFLFSVAGFTLASLLSAVAPSFEVLVAARALQGAAAAGMIPAALGLVLSETPPAKRGAAIGTWGAAGALAATVGPALAGLVIAAGSWRWIFLLNIPIGLAMLAVTVRAVRRDPASDRPLPDPLGTALVVLGTAAVVLGISEGGNWGWRTPPVILLLAGGLVAIGGGLLRSRSHPAPAVEIELWRNHRYAVANASSFLFGCGIYAWMLAGPLFVMTIWDYSVLQAALAVTPGAITSTIASMYLGRRATPQVQRVALVAGAACFGVVSVLMAATLTGEPRFLAIWLPASLLGGGAIGAVLTALTTASATSVPPPQFAAGTALTLTARQLGGAFGVAVMAALLTATSASSASDFDSTYIFCGLLGLLAALTGLLLRPATVRPPG